MSADIVDCLIIGGGPAGLTAAIYAARFRLSVRVVDAGASRAALIPCTRNQAGFPGGIAGADLLSRMRTQAMTYGATLQSGEVSDLQRAPTGFLARIGHDAIAARAVILATGVANHRPEIDDSVHAEALRRGLLRYCPVCDGFEVIDRDVAVIGQGARAAKEAAFLRDFTDRVTIIAPNGWSDFDATQSGTLRDLHIAVAPGDAGEARIEGDRLSLRVAEGRLAFESVYPALGSTVFSGLAAGLGASLSGEGCVTVDAHQRTSVPGLYAAGDVVIGLDQISHAMGEAGVAATTLRNDLAAQSGRRVA